MGMVDMRDEVKRKYIQQDGTPINVVMKEGHLKPVTDPILLDLVEKGDQEAIEKYLNEENPD
jgi:hypothetical protein